MRWERTSERLVRTLLRYPYFNQFIWSNLPIGPREEGKRWAVGNLKGGCVCHLDTYIPVSFFWTIGSDRSNRRVKVRWARKRKPERGYALHSDIHISVNSCDIFFWSIPRKWKEKRGVWKDSERGGGLYATQICTPVNSCDYWFWSAK